MPPNRILIRARPVVFANAVTLVLALGVIALKVRYAEPPRPTPMPAD